MRRFLKTVLFAGVPFGVLMGLAGAESAADFVIIAIVFGLLFGVVLGGVLSAVQWWMGRRAEGQGGTAAQGGARAHAGAQRSLVVEAPLEDAYRRCLEVTEALRKAEVAEADRGTATIEVRTGTSWKSWGERVTLHLSDEGSGRTTVSITSRPSVRTTIFDYGKNRDNVARVADWLTAGADVHRHTERRQ